MFSLVDSFFMDPRDSLNGFNPESGHDPNGNVDTSIIYDQDTVRSSVCNLFTLFN